MKKIIGIVLILAAVYGAYTGLDKLNKSEESVKVMGLELSAEDSSGKSQAYITLGLSVVSLLAGVYLVGGKRG